VVPVEEAVVVITAAAVAVVDSTAVVDFTAAGADSTAARHFTAAVARSTVAAVTFFTVEEDTSSAEVRDRCSTAAEVFAAARCFMAEDITVHTMPTGRTSIITAGTSTAIGATTIRPIRPVTTIPTAAVA